MRVELAEQDRARVAQALRDRTVPAGNVVPVDLRAAGRADSLCLEQVLQRDGDAVQRTADPAGREVLGRAPRVGARALRGHGDVRVDARVQPLDAPQVRLAELERRELARAERHRSACDRQSTQIEIAHPQSISPTSSVTDGVLCCAHAQGQDHEWRACTLAAPRSERRRSRSLRRMGRRALRACEFDAKDMAALAKSRKMQSTVLLTKKATRKAALAAMRAAAKTLRVRRSLLSHLLGPRRSGGRRHGGGGRQAGRDLVPLRRRADRRRALPGAQPLRGRGSRARALGQLPQRNGDARQAERRVDRR